MKTAPTNKKIRELIQAVREKRIVARPDFQRRLVWSRDDKNLFLDTILRNFPFPEIYLADGEVDLETGAGTQLLVDGLQRVSTIIQYFEGNSDLKLTSVPAYKDLDEQLKRDFLQYDVAVRDLGSVNQREIIEVFQRLNATKYSLLDIEVNNAVYAGALKKYAERVAADPFFETHRVFNAQDLKRMGDLRYALTIVITLMSGYFNRDDGFGTLLERFNDEFPLEAEIDARLRAVFAFIDECNLGSNSRAWRKADLLTLIVELDQLLTEGFDLQPSQAIERLERFYAEIEDSGMENTGATAMYYKAALQASNDRINRIRRGVVLADVLRGKVETDIVAELKNRALFT